MKKINSLLLAILVLALLVGCNRDNTTGADLAEDHKEKISVYTSFYPMYDFASKIGEDKVDLVNMIPAGTDPHDWEPTPSDIIGLEEADVFIYNGAGLEHWTEDILESLQNEDLIVVEASQGMSLIEGSHDHHDHDHDHSHHYHQEGFDPHVWLNPLYAKMEMENIKDALVKADPDNKKFYEVNYEKYAAEFDKLDLEFKETLEPLPNKDIVVSHQAFGYLTEAYGLNQVPVDGLSPESEPSMARVAEIIEFSKDKNLKVIFFEEMASPKVAETIAKAVNAKTGVLNTLESLSHEQIEAGEDYFSIMRQNLEALEEALR